MTCAENWIIVRKRCADSTSLSLPELTVPRGKTRQDVWSQIRVQWMTITSFVPCYAPRVPQHAAVSLFGPLNQIVISSAQSAETDFVYLD